MQVPGPDAGWGDLYGQHLGDYEVLELIGHGGMAVVYRGRQLKLDRDVAIKVLPRHYLYQPDFRMRFALEAHTAAHLEHPNILPIYDYSQDSEVPFIVMPLVTGGTLRDWLQQGASLDRALQVVSHLLRALEYAHTRQPMVVHRDVNPKNILMRPGDWPVLSDFGIAKILEPTPRITGPGTMIGTPEYVAPEQSQGLAVDQRADLYAMGVVLFEILTGRVPFEGPTPFETVRQHVEAKVPSVRDFNPALPPVWDAVIQRSLAKNPDDRYPSAHAMAEAIESARQQTQAKPQTRSPRANQRDGKTARRRWPWRRDRLRDGLTVLLLAVGIIAIAVVVTRPPASPIPAALLPVRVYVAANGDNSVAVFNPVNNLVETMILVGTRPGLVAGDAAGTRVYVANNGNDTLSVIDTASNSVVATVPVGESPFGVAVPQPGGRVYVGNAGSAERPGGTVSVVDVVSNSVVATVSVGSEPARLEASPDGRRVYVTNHGSASVSVIDTASNAVVATLPVGVRPAGVAVSPDGARVYVANAGHDTVSVIDTARNNVLATVRVGSRPVGLASGQDGGRLYVANEDASSVTVIDTASNSVIKTVEVGPNPFDVAASPDGSRVFVSTYGNRSLAVIDTERQAMIASVPVGANPLGVGVKP